MALNDNKVTTTQISTYGVVAAPDRLTGTAAQNKAVFDRLIREAVAGCVNGLIDALQASTAAAELGASVSSVTTKTVQAILSSFETAIANRYTKAETEALTGQETNSLVADVDVNLTTGVITVTKKDGTSETFDTAMEKVPARFEIVNSGGAVYLKITNVDGTSTQTDITSLMNVYTHANSDEIAWAETGTGNVKTVSAYIRANSIGLDKLSLSVISTIENYTESAADSAAAAANSATAASASQTAAASSAAAAAASQTAAAGSETSAASLASTATTKASEAASSASSAATKANEASSSAATASQAASTATTKAESASVSAIEAESYAKGGTNSREGEDTDNADYYRQQAQAAASAANSSAADALASASSAAQAREAAGSSAGTAQEKATEASASAASAAQSAASTIGVVEAATEASEDSEAWAVGTRSGVAVGASDPAYQNNAKYYKDQASEIVGGDYIPNAEKGAPSGVAELDSYGKVYASQLPPMDYVPETVSGSTTGAKLTDGVTADNYILGVENGKLFIQSLT